MAKIDTDEIGKPGKSSTSRRFPWRLWLFAIAMTAGAVAGGYYTWQFRSKANAAMEDTQTCLTNLGKQQKQVAEAADVSKKAAACATELADARKKATDLQNLNSALTIGANASKADIDAGRAQRAEAEKRLAVIDEIQKQLAKMIETHQLAASARRGSLVLALPADTLFAPGTADLTRPGELAVQEVGIALKRIPDRRFQVTGHTDDAPLKSAAYKDNWELSAARALSVTRLLIQAGVEPKNLVAAAAAETDPLTKDHAKNRRVEIAMLPTAGELPALPASLGADTARGEIPVEKPDPAKQDPAKAPAAPVAPAKPAPATPAPPKP
jgi:chemotaxis protein MotB